ncbi:MAG TPA: VWA domain-containing protein [Nannocystaceae bacterium]|nr:VWA domain-containing protein [Nannocystaceae bacterium]
MHRSTLLVALGSISCNACAPATLGDLPMTDGASGSGDDESTSVGASDTGDAEPEWFTIQLTVNKDVDLLFVIDDSASMGPFQERLAANFPAFVNVLEDAEVKANYRIAITTTDVGNPACAGASSERGAFVASSCRSRQADFVSGELDVAQASCLDNCAYDGLVPQPTTTAYDDVPRSRPWLESIEGNNNVGTTTTEAAQCWLPQGIAGCELVSPLEAGYLALERARTPGDPAYGFLRETAFLFVVYVTGGSDCSASPEGEAIFTAPNAFWTDPSAATQGACWSAGVACSAPSDGPDGTTIYGACEPADRGLDGGPAAPEDAVLFPIPRYLDQFEELRAERVPYGADVRAMAVAGYPIGTDELEFASSADPDVQREHGIAPNCTSDGGIGIPPVRVAAVVEATAIDSDDASICTDDYSPVLGDVADFIRDQIKPACVPRCVADADPSTVVLEPSCLVRQQLLAPYGEDVFDVPRCSADESLPDDAIDVCWVSLVGDDRSDYCTDEGSNLELRLVRREGHPAPGGTSVEITCEWSEQPAIDCPGT